jgi:Domain of unknown function (DUF4148)
MNLKTIASAAAFALSLAHGVALADPSDVDPRAGFVSTKTRAEVIAEAAAARAAVAVGEHAGEPVAAFVATKSRAQVRAELREAQRLGFVGSRGDAQPRVPTREEAEQIRQAGLRAAPLVIAAR